MNTKYNIHKNEISISKIYDKIAIIHVQPFAKELHIYFLTHNTPPSRQYTIPLCIEGRIFVHIIDSLIIAHNVTEKLSFIIDIQEDDLFVAPPLAMAPLPSPWDHSIYSKEWEFQTPNLIIDNRSRLIWEIEINLELISYNFRNDYKKLQFLSRRSKSKQLVVNIIKNMIRNIEPLSSLSSIFDCINSFLGTSRDDDSTKKAKLDFIDLYNAEDINVKTEAKGISLPQSVFHKQIFSVLLEEVLTHKRNQINNINNNNNNNANNSNINNTNNINTNINTNINNNSFLRVTPRKNTNTNITQPNPLINTFGSLRRGTANRNGIPVKYFINVLITYIKSLSNYQIEASPDIEEILVTALIESKSYQQLVTMLEFKVINDSGQLACKLLSYEKQYPNAHRLALEMFSRLGQPIATIIDVLLSQYNVIQAIKLLKMTNEKISAYRFLEVAKESNDNILFYNVFKYFQVEQKLSIADAIYDEYFQSIFPLEDEDDEEDDLVE